MTENEERNAHTENVLLLAEKFGTTVQIKSVKKYLEDEKYERLHQT